MFQVRGPVDTPVHRYLGWLKLLTKKLTEAGFRPTVLTGPELTATIHSESDAPLLAPNGEMHIPCSSSPLDLLDFFKTNVPLAKSMRLQSEKAKELMEVARENCMNSLKLEHLSWDSSLAVEEVLGCIDRLEEGAETGNLEFLKGKRLHLGRGLGYTVMEDGRLAIPINWEQ